MRTPVQRGGGQECRVGRGLAQRRDRGDPPHPPPPVASSCPKKSEPSCTVCTSPHPPPQWAEIELGGGGRGGQCFGDPGVWQLHRAARGGAEGQCLAVCFAPSALRGSALPPSLRRAGEGRGSPSPPARAGRGVRAGKGSPSQTWLVTEMRQEQ